MLGEMKKASYPRKCLALFITALDEMSMSKKHSKNKRESGGFIAISTQMLRSVEFSNLSAPAVKLLNDLMAQYNGNNNGDLSNAWTLMEKRGWKSRATLWRATTELLENDWLEKTRQGGRHKATLFAISFFAVDDCYDKTGKSKLDSGIKVTNRPKSTWRKHFKMPKVRLKQ